MESGCPRDKDVEAQLPLPLSDPDPLSSLVAELRVCIFRHVDLDQRFSLRRLSRGVKAGVDAAMSDVQQVTVTVATCVVNESASDAKHEFIYRIAHIRETPTESTCSLSDANRVARPMTVTLRSRHGDCARVKVDDVTTLTMLLGWAAPRASVLSIDVQDCHDDSMQQLNRVIAILSHLHSPSATGPTLLPCLVDFSFQSCFLLRHVSLWHALHCLSQSRSLLALHLSLCACVPIRVSSIPDGHALTRHTRHGEMMRRIRRWQQRARGDDTAIAPVEEMQRMMMQETAMRLVDDGHAGGEEGRAREDGHDEGPTMPIDVRHLVTLMQHLLDSCSSLETVNVDSVLIARDIPFIDLHYPVSMKHVISSRLAERGCLAHAIACSPDIEVVDALDAGFVNHPEDRRAIVAASRLRRLAIASPVTGRLRLNELAFTAFGATFNASDLRCPWPLLTSVILQAVQPTFLRQLCIACPAIETLHLDLLKSNDNDLTSEISETQLLVIGELAKLRELVIADATRSETRAFSDSLLDVLGSRCPRLHLVSISPCHRVTLLALPRLLARCGQLRLVHLPDVAFAIGTLDCLVTLMSIAIDLQARRHVTVVQVQKVTGETYESVGRIMEALASQEPQTQLLLSTMSESCLHDRECCAICCFDGREKTSAGAARTSVILSRRKRRNGAVVFTAAGKQGHAIRQAL